MVSMTGTSGYGLTEFNRYVTVDGKRADTLFVSRPYKNTENPNLFKKEYGLLRKKGFSRKEAMAYAINSAREKQLGPIVDLKGARDVKRPPPLSTKKNFWTGGIWEALTYIWVRRQGIRVIPCNQ